MVSSTDYEAPSWTPEQGGDSTSTGVVSFWWDIRDARLGSFGWSTHLFCLCWSSKLSPFLRIDLKDWNCFLSIRDATGSSNKELRSNWTLSQTLWRALHHCRIDSPHDFHLLFVLLQNTNLGIGLAWWAGYHNVCSERLALKPQGIWNFRVTCDKARQRDLLLVGLRIKDLKVSVEKAGEIRAWLSRWDQRFNYWDPFVLRLRCFLFGSFQGK